MSAKQSRFPLTLSSVVEKKTSSTTTTRAAVSSTRTDVSARSVVTPQTATRNAAQNQSRQAAKGSIVPGQSGVTSGLTGNRTASRPVASNPAVAASVRTAPLVSDAVRKAMVARVAKQGVRDPQVLAAMEAVPRHMFMEPALSSQAYIDASLPIGHHQTISQPYIVARMIEIMRDNQKSKTLDRVLEIGTGCGYQAAVLSLVAKEVYSIERIKPLHELAKNNLRPLRIANIRLHYGDGMLGLPQVAPFDGIILAAAGLEVPQALLEQLAIGGRLVAPVGARQQMLQLIVRVSQYEWLSETLEQCHFVPLRPGTV
jgi:protein-L-isoaspartate(D-aspartate) O-methyltransferase